MPNFSPEDLKEAFKQGTIRGVSLDSNVLVDLGCDLNTPILRELEQFKTTYISVIFSEIIEREVVRKIKEIATQSQSKLKSSLGNFKKRWGADYDIEEVSASLELDGDPSILATAQFSDFIGLIEANVIPVDGTVSFDELNKLYFEITPPFGNKKNKKHEFPDAMALLSLETWASQQYPIGYLLLVSKDLGWQTFSSDSKYLVCVDTLEEVFDYFNDSGRSVVDNAVSILRSETATELVSEINTAIEIWIQERTDIDYHVEASSLYDYEVNEISTQLISTEIAESTSAKIISLDKDTVTFSVEINCQLDSFANFDFYFSDSDFDNILFWSEEFSNINDVSLSVFLMINRRFRTKPKLLSITVAPKEILLNFETIEPSIEDV